MRSDHETAGGTRRADEGSPARADVEALQRQTRQILDSANDAFIAIDDRGTIIDWNRAAELTFGWTSDEAVGRPLAETVVPERYRAQHLAGFSRFLETGEGRVLFQPIQIEALHRDGRLFPVELTIWPTRTSDDRWRFNAFLRDISERRRLEIHAAVVHHVAAKANASTSSEDAVRDACRQVLDLTGWEVAHAYLASAQGRLEPSGWWEPGGTGFEEFRSLTATTTFEPGEGLPGRVAETGTPHWIHDVGADSNFPRFRAAAASGLVTAHAFPVLVGDDVVAVLEFYSARRHEVDAEMLTLMADVGLHLGRVFEREEADQWRTRMISTVSHELHTPLAAMTGMASLLGEGWDDLPPEERVDLLASIERQGERLQRLATDLLTLARLDDRRVPAAPSSIALAPLARQAAADLDIASVEISVPDDLCVTADPDHLLVVLCNLLGNAEKYGEPPIVISAGMADGEVELVVSDQGAGVDPEFVPHLFDEFTRNVRGHRGSGLGLSITRRMVVANGGTIRYEPGEPRGARFVVILPTA